MELVCFYYYYFQIVLISYIISSIYFQKYTFVFPKQLTAVNILQVFFL